MTYPPDFFHHRILYRDGMMLVIDKPAGLPVHPGPGGGDNLEKYFESLKFGLPRAPALAHRLDRDTSGCLVLGRHSKALRKLGKLFSEGRIEKTYWAVCAGIPEQLSGGIDAPILKDVFKSGWRMEIGENGKPARTTYRVLGQSSGLCFIEAKSKTGRTHQIRVHLASIGAPVLGDTQYGNLLKNQRAGPMMLHARRLIIPISKNRDSVSVKAPPPPPMDELLKILGHNYE